MYLLNYMLKWADEGIFVTIGTNPEKVFEDQIYVKIDKISDNQHARLVFGKTELMCANYDWEEILIDRIRDMIRKMNEEIETQRFKKN